MFSRGVKLNDQGKAFMFMMEKISHVLENVKERCKADKVVPNHDREDIRNVLDDRSKIKFKAVAAKTLTTEHKPEQM